MYPNQRLQRFRRNQTIRDMVTETRLFSSDFILPLFVNESLSQAEPVHSLPGVVQYTLGSLCEEVSSAIDVGVKAFILFGIPCIKDHLGTASYQKDGIVQKAIRLLRNTFPDIVIIADCCLCEYTDHGHCGVMTSQGLDNDATLSLLQKIAVSYAESGADIVAPSGMMDGMVQAIRSSLDSCDATHVSVMPYSIKYASQFYGPFRDAAGSDFLGERHYHQLNISQREEALQEASLDEQEGADYLIVKPAGFYMDMIRDLSQITRLPIVGYHVSGEYAMVCHAANQGSVDKVKALTEIYIGMKRAGARLIISYAAKEVASDLLKGGNA